MTLVSAEHIADLLVDVAAYITSWSSGPDNNGPWDQEVHRTRVQIAGALVLLAERLDPLVQERRT